MALLIYNGNYIFKKVCEILFVTQIIYQLNMCEIHVTLSNVGLRGPSQNLKQM